MKTPELKLNRSTRLILSLTSAKSIFSVTFVALSATFALLFLGACKPQSYISGEIGGLSVSAVSPASGFIAGGTTLTLSGKGFGAGMQVQVDGQACTSVSVISSTSATCTLPAHSAGTVDVIVDRGTEGSATLANAYTYSTSVFRVSEIIDGSAAKYGQTNGVGSTAKFYHPTDLVEHNGYLYVSDTDNSVIRRINISTREVTDFVGTKGTTGNADGTGTSATFNHPTGLVISGQYMYVSDTDNCTIRKVNMSTRAVTTFAGTAGSCTIAVDGATGSAARFFYPWGLETDDTYLYVADSWSHVVQKIHLSTATTNILAGINNSCGGADGDVSTATLCSTFALELVGTDLFVTTPWHYTVRKIDLNVSPEVVSTLAGTHMTYGSSDGIGTNATFSRVTGMASDGTYLYVADSTNNTIRRIEIANQTVITVAGDGSRGYADDIGTAAKLNRPGGLVLVGSTIYFSDTGNHSIRTYNIATGVVGSFAGYGGN